MKLPKARNVLLSALIAVAFVALGLAIAQDQETLQVRAPIGVEDPRFPRYLARLLGHTLTMGDVVIVHTNGEEAFPAMLRAIDGARHRVSFESYIFGEGTIPDRFTEALAGAAARGVEVRVVLDALGAKGIAPANLERLEEAGVAIGWFNPVSSYSLEEANYRTHRKALVIDGSVAFVGGIGVADQWVEATDEMPRWRDTHFELRGRVALDVEAAFHENWIETGGIVEPDVLPHTDATTGPAQSIVVWSSPEGGTNSLKLLYLLSIAAARQTLDIQSPYFITDESTEWSLLQARRRGVRVRLLLEGDKTDAKPVKFASRSLYGRLLEHGIEIYEYQPTMMHTKVVVVDGLLTIAGSANFDNRSLELNDELNVVIFDRTVAAKLVDDLETDLEGSQRITLEAWRARPFHIRARDKLWSYFGEVF